MIFLFLAFIALVFIMGWNAAGTPSKKLIAEKKQSIGKLTIKVIIRWEQLRNKSFALIDYSDKDDVNALLYLLSPDASRYTLEVFSLAIDEKTAGPIIKELEIQSKILNQYQKEGKKSDCDPEMVGNIIATLIINGIDANYAYNELELCDLPMLIEAYENKKKESMEASRLWTYFSILPHVDGKKLKNVQDLITFPWEEESIRKENEENAKKSIDEFEKAMKIKKSDLWGN